VAAVARKIPKATAAVDRRRFAPAGDGSPREGIAGLEIAEPMVVCNEEYRFVIAEQLRLMGTPGAIVLEPFGRNTAPALTLAALAAMRDGGDPVLLVMPSDHVILDVPAFQSVVREGAELAERGAIVTFGITPDSPETGYGYIQGGDEFGDGGPGRLRALSKSRIWRRRRFILMTVRITGTAACS